NSQHRLTRVSNLVRHRERKTGDDELNQRSRVPICKPNERNDQAGKAGYRHNIEQCFHFAPPWNANFIGNHSVLLMGPGAFWRMSAAYSPSYFASRLADTEAMPVSAFNRSALMYCRAALTAASPRRG